MPAECKTGYYSSKYHNHYQIKNKKTKHGLFKQLLNFLKLNLKLN